MRLDLSVTLLTALTLIDAHKHPMTEHERELQRALQTAAYHVGCTSKKINLYQQM